MNSVAQNLIAAKQLYSQLLVLVGTVIANPTQQNIDAAITAINKGTWTGLLQFRLNYSLDGESYQWADFYSRLLDAIKEINALIQAEAMPFVITSRARC